LALALATPVSSPRGDIRIPRKRKTPAQVLLAACRPFVFTTYQQVKGSDCAAVTRDERGASNVLPTSNKEQGAPQKKKKK
jgi:hypothetical protein